MIDLVVARLRNQVSDLRSVEGAAEFKKLLAGRGVPQNDPAAYVIPLGMRGGKAEAITGMFTQQVAESIGVVLFLRGHDQTGARALGNLRPFIATVIEAIAGWQPSGEIGVFQLSRGALVDINGGLLSYQLDFSINDQLRIAS